MGRPPSADDDRPGQNNTTRTVATPSSKPEQVQRDVPRAATESPSQQPERPITKEVSVEAAREIGRILTARARELGLFGVDPNGGKIQNFQRVKEPGSVNAVQSTWRNMSVAVDSGASESVMPTGEVPGYPVRMPEKPVWYANCNGGQMQNEGEQNIPMMLPSGEW